CRISVLNPASAARRTIARALSGSASVERTTQRARTSAVSGSGAGAGARAGAQAASAHRAGPRAKDGRVNAGAVVLQTAGLTSGVSGDKSPGDRARAAGPGTTPGPSTSGPFRHPVQTPS